MTIPRQTYPLATLALLFLLCGSQADAADNDLGSNGKESSASDQKAGVPGRVSFAVVIGNNKSLGVRRPDLHYADDDAARYFEILQTLAPGRVSLLADFDRDTQRLFPETKRHASPPTRKTLEGLRQRLAEQVQAAQLAGHETELYFIFAGHGDVARGEGFVELADARFTSRDLEAWLGGIPFTRAHVILDSCNSFFMLGVRKPGGRHFATAEDAARALSSRLPNVGVFLSTSAEGEAFEWSEIQSGIFSHVVRSGLLGAADANADGSVSYLELAAFVDTATADVRNPNMRPHVFSRGPGAADSTPIVRLRSMTAVRRFELSDLSALRIRLRDANGLPTLDAHAEHGVALQVALPEAWAHGAVVERTQRAGDVPQVPGPLEFYAVPEAPETVTLAVLQDLDPQSAVRGPAETFNTLFTQPYGPNALANYVAGRGAKPPPVFGVSKEDTVRMELVLNEIAKAERSNRLATAIGSIGAGGFIAVAGVGMLPDSDLSRAEKRRPRAVSGVLLGVSGIFVLGGSAALLGPSDGEKAAAEFRQVVKAGGDTSQAFAAADKRLQVLLAARQADRLSQGIFGGASLVGSGVGLLWSELAGQQAKRKGRRLLAAGGMWLGVMMLGDALMASTPAETLTTIWRDDPSLIQYQTSVSLDHDGASITLAGTWGK